MLSWEDATERALSELYGSYGYRRYHMGKLESYDLYMENGGFLTGGQVITFPDGKGRLTALKPDVTMSIVKSTLPEDQVRKLYYAESVFRIMPGSGECRELKQMGLESIGPGDLTQQAEVVLLAMKSLHAVSGDYVVTLGHMGLVCAVLEQAALPISRAQAIDLLRRKSMPELERLVREAPVSAQPALRALMDVSHPAGEALGLLSRLELTGEAAEALEELKAVYTLLRDGGHGEHLRIDFSTVGDTDYYNGVVFHGFVRGAAGTVLSGGRYDRLMRRFGKSQCALGFAVYLNELSGLFRDQEQTDADVLLLCPEGMAAEALDTARRLRESGQRVLLSPAVPRDARVSRVLELLRDGTTREVTGSC